MEGGTREGEGGGQRCIASGRGRSPPIPPTPAAAAPWQSDNARVSVAAPAAAEFIELSKDESRVGPSLSRLRIAAILPQGWENQRGNVRVRDNVI